MFTVPFYLQATQLWLLWLRWGALPAAPPPWSANRTWGPHTGSCLAKLELSTLAEAKWGRVDKQEGNLSRQREVSRGVYGGILSSQHRELQSPSPSYHQDLPVSSLALQQG